MLARSMRALRQATAANTSKTRAFHSSVVVRSGGNFPQVRLGIDIIITIEVEFQ